MAIDIKKIICDALLELNQTKHLEKITIKDILTKSQVSKQTFYNHFLDKNDLIQYIYDHYIIVGFDNEKEDIRFYDQLLLTLYHVKKYHTFMKQACLMDGQNNLRDYMIHHCEQFDLKWHQELYGNKPIPEALKFATIYHANASSAMTLSWILSDMPTSCEEMAQLITKLRAVGMDELFKDGDHPQNPYTN